MAKPALATCSYRELNEPTMGLGVRISMGTPRWFRRDYLWPYLPDLTPQGWYINASDAEFSARYLNQLTKVGAAAINRQFNLLAEVNEANRLVLCCFEKLDDPDPSKWCHRTLFASWWLGETGEQIPELGAVTTRHQETLF